MVVGGWWWAVGGWWLVVGGGRLVVGGWWLVAGGPRHPIFLSTNAAKMSARFAVICIFGVTGNRRARMLLPTPSAKS